MIYQSANSGNKPLKFNAQPAHSLIRQIFHHASGSINLAVSSCSSIFLAMVLLGTYSPASYSSALDHLEQAQIADSFEKQSKTTKLISYLVDKSHFKKVPLDDSFSEKILEQYIDQLRAFQAQFGSRQRADQHVEKFRVDGCHYRFAHVVEAVATGYHTEAPGTRWISAPSCWRVSSIFS